MIVQCYQNTRAEVMGEEVEVEDEASEFENSMQETMRALQ